jgi:hypothetical protein
MMSTKQGTETGMDSVTQSLGRLLSLLPFGDLVNEMLRDKQFSMSASSSCYCNSEATLSQCDNEREVLKGSGLTTWFMDNARASDIFMKNSPQNTFSLETPLTPTVQLPLMQQWRLQYDPGTFKHREKNGTQ